MKVPIPFGRPSASTYPFIGIASAQPTTPTTTSTQTTITATAIFSAAPRHHFPIETLLVAVAAA